MELNHSQVSSSSVDATPAMSSSSSSSNYWWFKRSEDGSSQCVVCKKPLSARTSKPRHERSISHKKGLKDMGVLDLNLSNEKKPENDAVSKSTKAIQEYIANFNFSDNVQDFNEVSVSGKPETVSSNNDPACQKVGIKDGSWKCIPCNKEFTPSEYNWQRHVKRQIHKQNLSLIAQNEMNESKRVHQENEQEEYKGKEEEEEYQDEPNQDQEIKDYENTGFKRLRGSNEDNGDVPYSHANMQQTVLYNSGGQTAQIFTQPIMHPAVISPYSNNNYHYEYNSAQIMIQPSTSQQHQPSAIAATHASMEFRQQQQSFIIKQVPNLYFYPSQVNPSNDPQKAEENFLFQ